MIPGDENGSLVGGWPGLGAAIGGIIGGILWLRTKLSKDASTIASDRAEKDMLDRYREENSGLREQVQKGYEQYDKLMQQHTALMIQHAEAVSSIKGMSAKQISMQETIDRLEREVSRLNDLLTKGMGV